MKQKAFTFKALIFGTICLLIVCFFPAFSSKYMLLKNSISGYLPVLPLFLIILISFLWNIIAGKVSKKLTLNSKELAVVFCIMIFISWIPHTQSSLVRQLILPRYTELRTNPTWKEARVTMRLSDDLFPEALGKKGQSQTQKEGKITVKLPDELLPGTLKEKKPSFTVSNKNDNCLLEIELKDIDRKVISKKLDDGSLKKVIDKNLTSNLQKKPNVNISEKGDKCLIGIELANIDQKDVEIQFKDGVFTVNIDKKARIGKKVHDSFIQGGLKVKEIPYSAWTSPMLRWIPILLVLSICVFGLAFIVHKQWSYHEQLRYPLASVVDSLIKQDDSGLGGTIYRNRLFIAGFTFVFFLKLMIYLNTWFPTQIPKIPSEYALGWGNLFPILRESNALLFCVHWMSISFAMIGIAFLVPSDVSLSVGLTAPLGSLLAVNYFVVTGNPVSSGNLDLLRSGGFIAFGLILLYTGRTYYFPLFLKALLPVKKSSDEIDKSQVWAARIFILAYICLIVIFRNIGFDYLVSFVYVTFLLLVFLVVTRLVCETGIPEMMPYWSLPNLMTGLFGPAAIGALPIIFMSLLSSTIANSTSLSMPYMATGLRILDDNKVNLKRFAFVSQFVILLALVVCLVSTLTISYTKGEGDLETGEKRIIKTGVTQVLNLKETGDLKASEAASGFEKLNLISSDSKILGYVLAGIIAVLGLYILRFRFAKWPLHPIFLILLGTGIAQKTWFCFLFGWLIKNLVVKFGGGSAYNKVKSLFIGFIIGEFTCFAVSLVVGLIYFLVTGNEAGNFR